MVKEFMGKIESVIYYCDICNVKAMKLYPTCDVCGKEVCSKCSNDIIFTIHQRRKSYTTDSGTTHYGYDTGENIFMKNMSICVECIADKENLKSLFLKKIEKVEKKGKKFRVGT